MKIHDLHPAEGSVTKRTRVGRGIAAGKGKTAGRGTKGQKARAGGSIPPWFEGGQTPLHMRIPKLRGFKNRFKIEYDIVNVGAIGALADRGAFEVEAPKGAKGKAAEAPITINQDILRAVGLVRTLDKPLKILGAGDLSVPLFVVADAFTASARTKIEAAGGSVNVLEVPTTAMPALGREPKAAGHKPDAPKAAAKAAVDDAPEVVDVLEADATVEPDAADAPEPEAAEPATAEVTTAKPAKASAAKASAAKAAKPAKATRAKPAKADASAAADEAPAAEPTTASDDAETPAGDA